MRLRGIIHPSDSSLLAIIIGAGCEWRWEERLHKDTRLNLSLAQENKQYMTLANKITLLRIILVPVFIVFTIPDATWTRFVAASIFVLACATDPLDGYFARSRSEVTVLGAFLDPLADKLLTMSAFIVMVKYQIVTAWMAILIVGREVSITGFRAIVSQQAGVVIVASRWGKIKTLVQMIGGSILLFMIPTGDYSREVSLRLPLVANFIMAVILATTVWSGWVYVREYKDHLRSF